MAMNKKLVLRWIRAIVLIYALGGIFVYYLQDYILLHPEQLPKDHKYDFEEPYREINIPYTTNSSMNIIQFTTGKYPVKGVILYFHGNSHNISEYNHAAPMFTKHGYEVWMLDYPGFGKSTGNFTEQRLYDWALTFYKLARSRFPPDSIIIYGRSLGSGIAAQLASIRDCRSLILETPYYSIPSLFSSYAPIYPFENIMTLKLPTGDYLKNVDAPVTIFHGDDDNLIPIRNARKLKAVLKPGSEFIEVKDGGHNDLTVAPVVVAKLDSLLKK